MLKVGDIFEADIHDLTSSGQGVLKHSSGMTVFASGVWVGERGRFQVSALRKRFAQASLIELLTESEFRRNAPCPYHVSGAALSSTSNVEQCGGCAWMFINYEAQLKAKSSRVSNAISRLNPRWLSKIKPIIGSEKELGYRNRVQFKTDGEKLGFVAEQSNTIVNVHDCIVLESTLRDAMADERSKLPNDDWKPSKKKSWLTLDMDDDHIGEAASINRRLPFRQGNTAQNVRMKAWLENRIKHVSEQLSRKIHAAELFCGSGNFTEVLRPYCERILAAECSEDAIGKIRARDWDNLDAKVVDLFNENAFSGFISKCKGADVLVLDPPRDGLKVTEGLFTKKVSPKHVLYISCDLATFVRDLTVFSEKGYKLKELQAIDLFPNTPHIELMAHIAR